MVIALPPRLVVQVPRDYLVTKPDLHANLQALESAERQRRDLLQIVDSRRSTQEKLIAMEEVCRRSFAEQMPHSRGDSAHASQQQMAMPKTEELTSDASFPQYNPEASSLPIPSPVSRPNVNVTEMVDKQEVDMNTVSHTSVWIHLPRCSVLSHLASQQLKSEQN